MEEITGPVKELLGKKILGVIIDDSPELREWLLIAKLTERRYGPPYAFGLQLRYLTNLVKRLRNAKSLSHDPALSQEEQQKFNDFVWKPSEHPNLSEALQINAACCRYYHVLFFVLASHTRLGRAATVYGKILPGQNFGYTWVIVKNDDGKITIVDLYEETICDPGDRYEDPSGKYQNGKAFIGYDTVFQFLTFD
jgi:hypothetical protein